MKYRKLGNSEIEAPVVAFGSWAIGGWMWGGSDEDESSRAIDAAIDNGMTFIDTAPIYGYGLSESIIGKTIKDKRDKVIIATKCGLRWDLDEPKGELNFYSTESGVSKEETERPVYKYLNPNSISEEIEQSLRRLQTDYIDLYQTHWQDPTTLIEDTMSKLLKLKDEGKIRVIGVSNASPDQMKEYGDIQTDQEKFNMFQKDGESSGKLNYCKGNGIAFLAYSPLAYGLLTGKMKPGQKFGEGDVRNSNPLFKPENIEKVNLMLQEWQPICDKYNADFGQIAAAWTFEYPGITHVLLGTRTGEQAIKNAKAGSIELDSEDLLLINELFTKYFK